MKRITNVKSRRARSRTYESPLRDEQAEATRTKILDALVRTMAKGVAGLSIPAVAREADVSIPTVYRHFGTKADLVAALGPRLFEKTGLMEIPKVEGDDLGSLVRALYRRNESLDSETRAALASQLGQEARLSVMPQRFALIRKEMSRRIPGLSGAELDRFTRLALILMSSATTRAYKDYLGMDANDAAEDIAWTLETLQRAQRRGKP
jgi:AcrR family transcriptional regulator